MFEVLNFALLRFYSFGFLIIIVGEKEEEKQKEKKRKTDKLNLLN